MTNDQILVAELKDLCKVQSYSGKQELMYNYLVIQLKAIGCDVFDYNGCLYATKGKADTYPCIASHMDTVHPIVEDLSVLEVSGKLTGFNKVTMTQTGIGGDDKVGIFIALQCLKTFDNIKAVFFRDEEIGCVGSYEPCFEYFDDCEFVLQCDRRGNSDFVTTASGTKLSGKDFQKAIAGILRLYGYSKTHGYMTDVMALKESGISCAMANMSCGYYNPHMDNEYIVINDVINCLDMVKEIIEALQGKVYTCEFTFRKPSYSIGKSKKGKGNYGSYSDTNGYDDWNDKDADTDINRYGDYYFDARTGNWVKENSFPEDMPPPSAMVDEMCDACIEVAQLRYVAEYNAFLCNKCIGHDISNGDLDSDKYAVQSGEYVDEL